MLECLNTWSNENITFTPVKGGLTQTIWLQPGVDDIRIVQRCAERGIAVTPVSPCFMRQPAQSGLVLNFSGFDQDSMFAAMCRLSSVLQEFAT
jgi:DNA-binding transcriptional MocR family regulator